MPYKKIKVDKKCIADLIGCTNSEKVNIDFEKRLITIDCPTCNRCISAKIGLDRISFHFKTIPKKKPKCEGENCQYDIPCCECPVNFDVKKSYNYLHDNTIKSKGGE